jgi:ATP-dependent Zn protease
VSEALGKARKTLGEGSDTRQRELNELYINNDFFVEYFLSDTRQGKKKIAVAAAGNGDGAFAECNR